MSYPTYNMITYWKYKHGVSVVIESVIRRMLQPIDEEHPITGREQELLNDLHDSLDRAHQAELTAWNMEGDRRAWYGREARVRMEAIRKKFQDLDEGRQE